MDCGGFAVVGSRPPTVLSSHRPGSAQGKRPGYHTVARSSAVDESLFRSQHPTRLNEFINFKAPWEYPKPAPPRNTFGDSGKIKVDPNKDDKKPRGRPLFWSPSSETPKYRVEKKRPDTSMDGSLCQWNTRGKYHQLKHTPTFVDETLFGGGLQEPTFEAPWNERKKGEKKKPRPYLWDPTGGPLVDGHGGVEVSMSAKSTSGVRKRPATALGISRTSTKGGPMPVWKP